MCFGFPQNQLLQMRPLIDVHLHLVFIFYCFYFYPQVVGVRIKDPKPSIQSSHGLQKVGKTALDKIQLSSIYQCVSFSFLKQRK